MPLSTNLFTRYEQELQLRNYARSTIKTYKLCLRKYSRWLHPTHPRDATDTKVREYLYHLLEHRRSRAWVSQNVSALRFLYIELYRRPPHTFQLRYPRKQQRLPYVPTRPEIQRLAGAISNRKHRLAVLLLYASGLRVGELIALNVSDLNPLRRTVHVHSGKGGKDRVTIVSSDLLDDLTWIIDERPPRAPLIPANHGGRWSTRSLQKVVRRAANRANLPRNLTPHSLRHAFATHLLEDGTELRFIQSLLGHSNIQTTTRYTQVRDPRALDLESPL